MHMCNTRHELIKVIKGLQQEKSLDTVEKVGTGMEGAPGAQHRLQAQWAGRRLRKTGLPVALALAPVLWALSSHPGHQHSSPLYSGPGG